MVSSCQQNTFHWVDYLVFALSLVISVVIGIFYAWKDKRKQNTAEFLLGGRKMSTFPVTLSLMASFLSAVLVLGVPAEVFYHDTMYWLICFSNIITFPVAVHAFLPVFHNLKINSAYEYFELRFNKAIRVMGCIVFQLQMIFYMAVVLYAPALALNQVMGISMYVSILAIGLVCTFYTAIGGLKAVMWTDTFQMMVVFSGLLALVIKGTMEVGGFQFVWDTAKQNHKLQADNFDPSPLVRHTFWTLVIGGFVTSMTIYGGNQAMIQRYLSMKTVKSAQIALYWNLPASIIFTSLLVYLGLVMHANYLDQDVNVEHHDQLIPKFVMDILGPYHGLPGLMVACIFSASLSTVSSGLNALALVFMTDIVQPLYKKATLRNMNDVKATVYSKFVALVFGFLTIGLAFVAGEMGSLILQIALSIFGMFGGPLLGLYVAALFFPVINSWGAGTGLVCSLGFTMFLSIGSIVNRDTSTTAMNKTICANHPANATIGSFFNSISTDSGFTTALDTYNISFTSNVFSNSTSLTSLLFNNSIYPAITNATPAPAVTISIVDNHINTTTNLTAVETTLSIESEAKTSGLDQLYSLSYMWYSTVAVCVCVTVGIIVSYLTGGTRKKPVKKKLLSPLYLWIASFSRTQNSTELDIEDEESIGHAVSGQSIKLGNGALELNTKVTKED